MSGKFAGKVVLITGAGSGIGRATAILLSKHGATLELTDINEAGLKETATLLSQSQDFALKPLDIGSSEAVTAWIKDLASKHPNGINHIFNCAGVNPTSIPTEELTDAYYDKLMNANLRGLFNVTRAVIPHLSPSASFVNVSSISGLRPTATHAIYCATKYGIIGFSKSMALELGPRGIRTNIIAPGYIDTPTNAGVVKGGEFITKMENGNALGRMGTPEEIAEVVMFLFSEESRYMNGSVVEIDGGLKG
ncbi:NAD(P)-binding protein [Lophium mytilinum]|uniref:NAD(P)-binding protein n=1 Tax=Lophium mytilinum TaxID=390894 RepID=A0A6A6QF28_9PEZI|nr:NAD(P)-binding protein [Lophium mytilinum]